MERPHTTAGQLGRPTLAQRISDPRAAPRGGVRRYGTFQLASELGERQTLASVFSRLGLFLHFVCAESWPVGPPLAVVGIVELIRRCAPTPATRDGEWVTPFGRVMMAMFVVYVLAINTLANLSFSTLHMSITARLWQQAFLVLCVAAGVGFASLAARLHGALAAAASIPNPSAAIAKGAASKNGGGGGKAAVLGWAGWWCSAVVMAFAFAHGHRHWNRNDHHDNTIFEVFGRDLLEGLPNGSTLLVNDDMNCNPAHYLHRCLGVRAGEVHVVRLPLITYNWWRPMQLHHFKALNHTAHRSGNAAKKPGGGRKRKKSAAGDLNTCPWRDGALMFPGSRHHPFERHLGAFAIAEFVMANLDPAAWFDPEQEPSQDGAAIQLPPASGEPPKDVFVAGEWKARQRRVECWAPNRPCICRAPPKAKRPQAESQRLEAVGLSPLGGDSAGESICRSGAVERVLETVPAVRPLERLQARVKTGILLQVSLWLVVGCVHRRGTTQATFSLGCPPGSRTASRCPSTATRALRRPAAPPPLTNCGGSCATHGG